MKKRELAKLMGELDKLTRGQRNALMAELSGRESKVKSIEVIESQTLVRPPCPSCGSVRIVKNSMADGLQRYKCKDCNKSFNALTGTPLARLRQKGKWIARAAALRDGLTLEQIAERLDIATSTAFRWRHRFLQLPQTVQAQLLTGIAEADETFFLRSHKGHHDPCVEGRKRAGKATKRGASKEQVAVLMARERAGSTSSVALEADNKASVVAVLKPILAPDAILCTDGSPTLAAAAKEIGVTHRPANLSAGIRIVAGVYHVQNVNAYDSRLKDWMRRFKGVSTRYLPNDLGWFRALERTPGSTPEPAQILAQAVRK
jgi:transposase-like protein